MKVGAERLPDITLTFLSPFSHVLHHHLELELAPLWFIPTSTYIQAMCPRKHCSRMPCESNGLKRKDRQVRYRRETNQRQQSMQRLYFALCRGFHWTP